MNFTAAHANFTAVHVNFAAVHVNFAAVHVNFTAVHVNFTSARGIFLGSLVSGEFHGCSREIHGLACQLCIVSPGMHMIRSGCGRYAGAMRGRALTSA